MISMQASAYKKTEPNTILKIIKPTQVQNYKKNIPNHAIKNYMGVAFGEGILLTIYTLYN